MARGGTGVDLDLHFDQLQITLDEATPDILNALAFKIEGGAKARMDQVDTGFAANTIQALPVDSSGVPARTETRFSPKEGRPVEREAGDLPAMGSDEAGVGVGAAYGAVLEARKPFLYPAAVQVAQEAGATVQAVAKKHGLGE